MNGIAHHARHTPAAAAIVVGSSVITFAEMDERQRRIAGALTGAGLRTGDRIAVWSVNRAEVPEIAIGALRTGIVPVPINPLLTPHEAAYILEDSGASWLFTDRRVEPGPGGTQIVTFGDAYERLVHDAKPLDTSGYIRGRPMHYTSGTTGRPKGVWVEPCSPREAAATSGRFRSLWGLDGDEVHLVCSPLAHSAPLRFLTRTLESGGTVVLQRKFDAAETIAAIELFGVTSTFMVPTHLERILALGDGALRRHDLSSMRALVHAGAPIRPATKRAVMNLFDPGAVWEFYGSTEGQATRISGLEWNRKPGSVGRALPGAEIRILDDEGTALPPGEIGDVWVCDPAADRFEYWGDRAKTDEAWRDGAFTVEDLGHVDDDGYLFLAGRKHDVIISGGVNVYPQEVEAVLCSHPQIIEAAVYGVDNAEWGQEVRAAVIPSGRPLDPDEVRGWARERLAGYKAPRRVTIVEELPRTPTGKVARGRIERDSG